mmetsp:Transcript_24049/g.56749  ORF Transcript_24049/g.56749 Transcript_24049/m.56749 type:complete len:250 (-) Transcript_24049:214-963(-)
MESCCQPYPIFLGITPQRLRTTLIPFCSRSHKEKFWNPSSLLAQTGARMLVFTSSPWVQPETRSRLDTPSFTCTKTVSGRLLTTIPVKCRSKFLLHQLLSPKRKSRVCSASGTTPWLLSTRIKLRRDTPNRLRLACCQPFLMSLVPITTPSRPISLIFARRSRRVKSLNRMSPSATTGQWTTVFTNSRWVPLATKLRHDILSYTPLKMESGRLRTITRVKCPRKLFPRHLYLTWLKPNKSLELLCGISH